MSSPAPINPSKETQFLFIPCNHNISDQPIKGVHKSYYNSSNFPITYDPNKNGLTVDLKGISIQDYTNGNTKFMAEVDSNRMGKEISLNLASLQIGHDDRPNNQQAQRNALTSQHKIRYYSNTLEKFEAVINDDPRADFEEACMKRYARVYSAYTTMFEDCRHKITNQFSKTKTNEPKILDTGTPNSFAEYYPPANSDLEPDFKIVVELNKAPVEESKEIVGLDDNEAPKNICEFPVHKMAVMQKRVPALHTALKQSMKDSIKFGVYTFGGTTKKAVEQFIKFLYTNSVTLENDQEGVELYRLADQYQFEDLKKVTQSYAAKAALSLADPERNDELLKPETFKKHLSDAETITEVEQIFNTHVKRIKELHYNYLSTITKDLYTK